MPFYKGLVGVVTFSPTRHRYQNRLDVLSPWDGSGNLFFLQSGAGLRTLVDRDRVDRELDEELRHHVALETESRRAQGIAPAEARRQALATLGGSSRPATTFARRGSEPRSST